MQIAVGQKLVKKTRYDGNVEGIVIEEHKTERRGNVLPFAVPDHVVFTAGDSEFTCLFADGHRQRIYERELLRGKDYQLDSEIVTSQEIEFFKARETAIKEIRDIASSIKADMVRQVKDELKAKYSYLIQSDSHVDGAKNIRTELKKHFSGTKFSVRARWATHSSAIDVRWTDGPTVEEVKAVIGKFQDSDYDWQGYREPNHFADMFGGSRFLSCDRDYSDALVSAAIKQIHDKYCDKSDPVPAVEDYRNGKLWNFSCSRYLDQYNKPKRFDDLIHQTISKLKLSAETVTND